MLAFIGGTGLYAMDELQIREELRVMTPFGAPSANIVRGQWGRHEVLFLPRHGGGHQLLPHEINYRANIYALKQAGATQVIGVSATGSLDESLPPGALVLPQQYFDWTRGKREQTFFGAGLAAHVSTAEPVCVNLTRWIAAGAEQAGIPVRRGVTYAGVEGPRLGTRAESLFLKQAGCHVLGMTNVPEVFLAREAQLCYASIGIVTDYDCWMDDPAQHVKATEIFAHYSHSLARVKTLLSHLMRLPLPAEDEAIRSALSTAVLTPPERFTLAHRALLEVLGR